MTFFALLCRAAAAALVVLGYPSWVFVALGVFGLLLVPRKRNLVLIALALAGLAVWTRSFGPGAVALGALVATLFAQRILCMNGVDRYFVAQDRPGTPMNRHLFVEVKEPLERPQLTRAVSAFQRDIPIARSFVHEGWLGVERFVSWNPLFGRPLRWLDRPLVPEDLDAPIDLLREPPFRVLHTRREGGGHVLVLTVHHSAADGTAGFLLLQRLLQRYDEHRHSKPEQTFPKDPPARRLRDLLRPRGLRWIGAMTRRHVKPMDKVGVQNASLLDDEAPRPYSSRHLLE
ncbi:MAG: hypothetical protein ACAI25_18990, partial [Planctomycetota bacterium]